MMKADNTGPLLDPRGALRPEIWSAVNRALIAKMLSEFLYEGLLQAEIIEKQGDQVRFRLELPQGRAYLFDGQRRILGNYRVLPESLRRSEAGVAAPAEDALKFVLDAREAIGMKPFNTAYLLKELSNTLMADTHLATDRSPSSQQIAEMGYGQVEGEMTGHPAMVFNKGRLGFGYDDYLAYAPEQKQPSTMAWVAVSRKKAHYRAVPGLEHEVLMRQELGEQVLANFRAELTEKGHRAEDYLFLPVHRWQWTNKIIPEFAADIARGDIVPLKSQGPDHYLPQQSIRTFVNIHSPEKRYVKLPLSILNTAVYRGLPGDRTEAAPELTHWFQGVLAQDRFLTEECGLVLLGEVASLNYPHAYYEQVQDAPYHFHELLGAIWRQSLAPSLKEGERAFTMASLLYVDHQGQPFVAELIRRSGLETKVWLQRLFGAVLPPLLHFLYNYGLAFSPHGENAVLVVKDFAPVRLAMKDFIDDVNLSTEPIPEREKLPGKLPEVLIKVPGEKLRQHILTGLFVCHFRYLSDVLATHLGFSERAFWDLVRDQVEQHQRRFPELKERFSLFDLQAPSFEKICLNRFRLLDYGYGDDSDRPKAILIGHVDNPLSRSA
ncbi:IucA/IucC family protein [Hyalangium rubrum]|uniref:IucA/IucC family siderophore biosynthesis protein n=1 Tax=Hyalangium rubrum TaxID=3103134 RepID=A0ABU5HGR7_9BACT|nr:IucA/IucC family siderophore biosynthesis protein [Hyalangium sp. s54d21]MDY7232541.1 IucA/IucC family siderophore biosynthesis protein [Hyalangium sp. s54d21]